ncbi:MAG: MarR family transcriptional regulator [Actinomycetes bacterium]
MVDRSPLNSDPIAEARRQWEAHGWNEAADGMAAVTSLMRAHQIALSRVETVLKPLEITFARYEVLMLLHLSSRGSLPMGVIGSRLQVHQTSVTNAVDRLEAVHLVARQPHPTDRRTTLVEISARGRSVAQRATEQLNSEVFTDPLLSSAPMREMVETLRDMRHQAGDF